MKRTIENDDDDDDEEESSSSFSAEEVDEEEENVGPNILSMIPAAIRRAVVQGMPAVPALRLSLLLNRQFTVENGQDLENILIARDFPTTENQEEEMALLHSTSRTRLVFLQPFSSRFHVTRMSTKIHYVSTERANCLQFELRFEDLAEPSHTHRFVVHQTGWDVVRDGTLRLRMIDGIIDLDSPPQSTGERYDRVINGTAAFRKLKWHEGNHLRELFSALGGARQQNQMRQFLAKSMEALAAFFMTLAKNGTPGKHVSHILILCRSGIERSLILTNLLTLVLHMLQADQQQHLTLDPDAVVPATLVEDHLGPRTIDNVGMANAIHNLPTMLRYAMVAAQKGTDASSSSSGSADDKSRQRKQARRFVTWLRVNVDTRDRVTPTFLQSIFEQALEWDAPWLALYTRARLFTLCSLYRPPPQDDYHVILHGRRTGLRVVLTRDEIRLEQGTGHAHDDRVIQEALSSLRFALGTEATWHHPRSPLWKCLLRLLMEVDPLLHLEVPAAWTPLSSPPTEQWQDEFRDAVFRSA